MATNLDEKAIIQPISEDKVENSAGGRPYISSSKATTRYRSNDKVYYTAAGSNGLDGPYWVASVDTSTNPPSYKLCDGNGNNVYFDGKIEVKEGCLSDAY